MPLDTRPATVDIAGYAGDTLTVTITVTGMDLTAAQWDAEVRAEEEAATALAAFVITPPTAPDGPAYLTLDSETTRLLAGASSVTRATRSGRIVQSFSGVWDCQVSDNGDDPVRTLVRGSLTLDMDVTRVTP